MGPRLLLQIVFQTCPDAIEVAETDSSKANSEFVLVVSL